MKNLWLLAVVLTTTFTGVCLSAQTQELPEVSGNAFLRLCSVIDKDDLKHEAYQSDKAVDTMACLEYLGGFTDGVQVEMELVNAETKRNAPAPFCIPDDVERGQMVRIVLKYIRENPAEAHKHTGALIMKALGKVYPCSSK
jgi:hypothetical protein